MVLQGSRGGHGDVDWMDTLWLHVPFWEFLGYSSKLCGRPFATSLAINQVEVILCALCSSVGNTHVKVTHGLRIRLSKM